ncbi:type IIL restriction-modification enzyme MmeI [Mesorhizobium sp.]|uniref:type IIL restriction-modification enzyme MmeI n=1 Tax=Mesorhizobium sp. TaxID=1871066 RepID=UPI00345D1A6B
MVVAMFGEDIKLLPAGTILTLADDCMKKGQSSYDLFGGLFTQMNTAKPATGGRFKDVPYFNGGVFQTVDPIDLTKEELALIASDEEGDEGAARKDWSKVNPAIFGAIFQQSMDAKERHAYARHREEEHVGPCRAPAGPSHDMAMPRVRTALSPTMLADVLQ